MDKKFQPLDYSRGWDDYWRDHPQGYSPQEQMINWAGQLNAMIDFFNEYFDVDLTNYVADLMEGWYVDGRLVDIINEALIDRLDTNASQLAEIQTEGIKLGEITHYGYFSVGKERSTIDYHAFEDLGQLNTTDSGQGYASFDAKPTMNNALDQNHLVGYQARPIYIGDGDLTGYMHGYDTDMEHSGLGTIEQAAGIYIKDVKGTGQILKNYGVYIKQINKGDENYQIYSEGTNPSVFNGLIRTSANVEGLSFLSNLTYKNGWKYNTGGYGGFGFTPTPDTMDLLCAVKNLGTEGEAAVTKKVAHIDYPTGSFVIDEKIGIGAVPETKLDIDDKYIRVRQNYTPPSSTAAGIKGLISYDSDYIYVCVADNVWKRSALTSW